MPDPKPRSPNRAWKLLPDIWELIKPRRGILAIGFVVMAINRVCGLVLPGSAKYLYDDVLIHRPDQLALRFQHHPVIRIVRNGAAVQPGVKRGEGFAPNIGVRRGKRR